MGDSNEPEAFMHNYYKAVRKYTENTYTRHSKPPTATAGWVGTQMNARAGSGMGAFIDDVIRIVTPGGALEKRQYAQNASKSDNVLCTFLIVSYRAANNNFI